MYKKTWKTWNNEMEDFLIGQAHLMDRKVEIYFSITEITDIRKYKVADLKTAVRLVNLFGIHIQGKCTNLIKCNNSINGIPAHLIVKFMKEMEGEKFNV